MSDVDHFLNIESEIIRKRVIALTRTTTFAVPRADIELAVKAPKGVKVESFWDEEKRGCVIRAGRFTSSGLTGETLVILEGNTGPGQFFDAEIAATRNLLKSLNLLP